MLVILKPEDYGLWLSREMHDPEQLQELYKPFPSNQLEMYPVPDLVNNPPLRQSRLYRQGLNLLQSSFAAISRTMRLR